MISKKRKLSKVHRDKILKNLISNYWKGKTFSEEHKRKISESKLGKHIIFSKDHNKKLSLALKGRKITWKDKMRKPHNLTKENSDKIITVKRGMHTKLHIRAYDYLYDKYGKKGIIDYIKWFKEKYEIS